MLTNDQARDRALHLVSLARKAGADAADAIYSGSGSTDVSIRLGALEDVQRSENEEIGLRAFVGSRSASVSTSDLSTAGLAALAERVVAMAKEAPEDPWSGLAPEDRIYRGTFPDLDLMDDAAPTPADLRERALACEDAARAVKGVSNSEGASASCGLGVSALATSHGFAAGYSGSSHSVSASVLAGDGGAMERDYAWHHVRHLADLDEATAIGTEAGHRAVARLNPAKLKSGPMTVIFDPRAGSSLLGHLIGAISGSSITRKTSFLLDRLGEAVFASGISIMDDPLRPRGIRSHAFDGEGLATGMTRIIDAGVLTTWLLDSAAARQLGLSPTGHAARGTSGPPGASASNLYMEAGTATPADLMADVERGLYVTDLIGMGVNPLTGDYSRGASGFLIEKGERTSPVSEITIAGNLKDMFARIIPANDLTFRYSTNVPTLRIDGMMIAGE
jgi:PmbA protein